MATFYVGPRPVLRGRSESDMAFQEKTHTLSGKTRSAVGVYSFYPLFAPGVLTGAPDFNHVLGTGYKPHDIFMERRYLGLDTLNPLDAPGLGARLAYAGGRFRPLEYKGLTADAALATAHLGHIVRTTDYSEFDFYNSKGFKGIPAAEIMRDSVLGHIRRAIGANVPSVSGAPEPFSFGAFDPLVFKGAGDPALKEGGQTLPTGFDNAYGHNRVMEWHGVPGAKAL